MTDARSKRQKRSERRRQEIQERRALRQEQSAHRRRSKRLKRFGLMGGAALLGIGVVFAVFTILTDWRESQPPEGVQTTENVTGGHSEEPIDYGAGLPPVGGVHSGQVQPCDFYSQPVPTERALHALEHGGVWVTYQPDLSVDEIDRLG